MTYNALSVFPWTERFRTVLKRFVSQRIVLQVSLARHFTSTCSTSSQMVHTSYVSTIDAEPLHRYKKGGYHPIVLGDTFKNGRYKVLHKLGWGGYSTVWAARDQREDKYVAIKVSVSKSEDDRGNREAQIMKKLAASHPSPQHVMCMLDDFNLEGPNGTHKCLVFELLGPSVPDIIETHFSDGRLPGNLAKDIAKQTLTGLDTLHQHNIGHGDIHTRNLAFTMPRMDTLLEGEFIEALGKPEIGHVRRNDGKALEVGIPEYIVRPAVHRSQSWSSREIKIIDLGESFLQSSVPQTLHAPLPVRAPEIIFRDSLDYRVDLWSTGCMLFELFVGQPPFDSVLTTPAILISQMREMVSDTLPTRWTDLELETMYSGSPAEISGPTLQEWLEEMYFDGERKENFTNADIVKLGRIIGKLLLFEPSTRASAREIMNDPWFRNEPVFS